MFERKRKGSRKFFLIILLLFGVFVIVGTWFQFATRVPAPSISQKADTAYAVVQASEDFAYCGKNWLRHNPNGLWEMYLEGEPFDRGVNCGKLTRELIAFQEKAFTDEILKRIPSPAYLKFLRYFIYWFNRNLDEYIPGEFKEEIYGISLSASNKYAYIGTNYQRMLNYHSAHDIGHALQEMKLVGCTSFGTWNSLSRDSSLIIGRNFDFYVGDEFARNKIVCFEKPSRGYPFMMITWASMTGVVSGMNDQGLTVTINAARSEIPWSARTPVSLLAREILQYSKNISEAYAIAEKSKTFISESFMIGSAADKKAVVIEKSPYKTSLLESGSDFIICTNHFQSDAFSKDQMNLKDMKENATVYREQKVRQDIFLQPVDPARAAYILRDRKGLNDLNIGNGNEKAVNQLIAHHSVIFEPEKLLVWVSSPPWQLGKYTCYDLFKIFHIFAGMKENTEISETDQTIPPDHFLETPEYQQFLHFRKLKESISTASGSAGKIKIPESMLQEIVRSNPDFFEAYETAGDYYYSSGKTDQAISLYYRALGKVIPRQKEKERIMAKLAAAIVKKKKNEK